MQLKTIIYKADFVGAIGSLLCLIHCALTPILIVSQVTDGAENSHILWKSLNYLFLIVCFYAIYRSTKTSSNFILKLLLFITWIILLSLMLNEELEISHIPETYTYITGFSLCIFHLYNLKYCQCEDEECCTPNQ